MDRHVPASGITECEHGSECEFGSCLVLTMAVDHLDATLCAASRTERVTSG
jgi:hypothetical protein